MEQNQVKYSLIDWQTENNTDEHSLKGTPEFAGNPSPSALSDYALTEGSPGKNAASDGTDMGADISKVYNGTTSINEVAKILGQSLIVNATPNPFKESIQITLDIPSKKHYQIALVNINGQEVAKIFSGELLVGKHTFTRQKGAALPNGVYFVTIRAKGVFEQLKVMHIK